MDQLSSTKIEVRNTDVLGIAQRETTKRVQASDLLNKNSQVAERTLSWKTCVTGLEQHKLAF